MAYDKKEIDRLKGELDDAYEKSLRCSDVDDLRLYICVYHRSLNMLIDHIVSEATQ